MMEFASYQAHLTYADLAQTIQASALWRRYLVTLTEALFGDDTTEGKAFLSAAGFPLLDPLKAAEPFAARSAWRDVSPAWRVLQAQVAFCLPLIENERLAFLKSDNGRFQSSMSAEYWDKQKGEYAVFHPLPEMNRELGEVGDPYDLSLAEMALLPTLDKRVERCGTYSYLRLFQMYPEDERRVALLARLHHKLTHATLLAAQEIDALIAEHDAFLERRLVDPLRVIL